MIQLVFVHGVATRDTPKYRKIVKARDSLFRELLFAGNEVAIQSPIWGEHVPSIREDVFVTYKGIKTYSLNVEPQQGLGGGLTGGGGVRKESGFSIEAVGRLDPEAALDVICSEIADRVQQSGREFEPEEIHAFRLAAQLIESGTAGSVFEGTAGASGIADALGKGMPAALGGVGNKVRDAVAAASDRVRNAASTLGFGAVREALSPAVGLFLGDVFVYLTQGERRENIRGEILTALRTAHAAASADKTPLIVVGHSMGGVILTDILTSADLGGLPDDFRIDALLTVGSQPGLFAELGLLGSPSLEKKKLSKPDCVSHWLNVFDPIDPLAFRSDVVFDGVTDLVFNSVAGIMEAHTKYFQRPQFFARTRKRLLDLKVLSSQP